MSSDERSPKRQRLSSYSPASTPTETKSTPFVQHPNTPPPSVHMSPSWTSQQLPGLGMAAAQGNGGGANFPTPPSPAAGYHSQGIGQSIGSEGESARQTPAAESERPDAEMREGASGDGDGDVSMAEDSEHRRTDHERTEGEDAVPPLTSTVGLFKVPTEPITFSNPYPTQNLLELFDLTGVQAAFARKDPVTGEKINKLRSSYQGKVKDLGLEGKNKASSSVERELEMMVHEEWDLPVPDGRSFWDATREHVDFSEQGAEQMVGMLGSALSGIRPGLLPKAENAKWKAMLGLDETAAKAPVAGASAVPSKSAANHFLSKTSPATAVQRSAPASPRATMGSGISRPDRSGKKRRYDDASWEGYDEDGYSTGDGGSRRGSASKRQKRKSTFGETEGIAT